MLNAVEGSDDMIYEKHVDSGKEKKFDDLRQLCILEKKKMMNLAISLRK